MAGSVLIVSVSGLTIPFSGIACDVYGNNCQYIGSSITTPYSFNLPPEFDTAPAIGMKIIDTKGCELFEILYCSVGSIEGYKQFQDSRYFVFMGSQPYQFQ
jgi:hypothetical protein